MYLTAVFANKIKGFVPEKNRFPEAVKIRAFMPKCRKSMDKGQLTMKEPLGNSGRNWIMPAIREASWRSDFGAPTGSHACRNSKWIQSNSKRFKVIQTKKKKKILLKHPVHPIFGRIPCFAFMAGLETGNAATSLVLRKPEKSEKSEKSVFQLFQLQHVVNRFLPNKIKGWEFSDFSKNFRGYGGGVENAKIMNRITSQIMTAKWRKGLPRRKSTGVGSRSVTVSHGDFFGKARQAFARPQLLIVYDE